MIPETIKIVDQKTVLTLHSSNYFELENFVKNLKKDGWNIDLPLKYNSGKNLWEITVSQPYNVTIGL